MHRRESTVEVADILRNGLDAYHAKYGTRPMEYYKIIHALTACRTAKLRGHVKRCDHCHHEEVAYNSCRNRHCPKCQAKPAAQWVQARVQEILPVPYYHAVFTLPHQLNAVGLRNRKAFYNLLFKAVSETLVDLAGNKKRLGAEIGFFCVLHTWGQNLLDHLHLHCVVLAGGLAKKQKKWMRAKRKFLFPIPVMRKLFQHKFLSYFQQAAKQGEIRFLGKTAHLAEDKAFRDFLGTLYHKKWVVYLKPPFGGPEQVVKYLSRYTHRIAISNRRIISMDNGKVSFRWKDYQDRNRWKVMTLDMVEFIRRFLLHFLPKGFVRIRYFGLLANRKRKAALDRCRKLLQTSGRNIQERVNLVVEGLRAYGPVLCPVCGKGHLVASFPSMVLPPGP